MALQLPAANAQKVNKMKAAVLYGPEDLRVEEYPQPSADPGAIVLKVMACAVCGSDLRIYREGNVRIVGPRIIGHEIAGEVVEVGDNVSKFVVGDRVSVGADIPCGVCGHCLAGRGNCCDTNYAMGYQFDGGFADFVKLPPMMVEMGPVRKFDDDLPYELAALAEPLACCINGYELAPIPTNGTVVIFGGGPIGLMLALLGRHYGARQVIVVEPSETRRQTAANLAADSVIDPTVENPVEVIMALTDGLGAETLFTACPVVATHEQAIASVAKRGYVNLFGGLPKSAPPISLLSNHLHYREAFVTGSHGSTPKQHEIALDLISRGVIDLKPLITHQVSLVGIAGGIEAAAVGNAIKVIVKPLS
jgi:L-iditol 2-dehydrogenase